MSKNEKAHIERIMVSWIDLRKNHVVPVCHVALPLLPSLPVLPSLPSLAFLNLLPSLAFLNLLPSLALLPSLPVLPSLEQLEAQSLGAWSHGAKE